MNTSLFGLILGAIGLVIILIGSGSMIATSTSVLSQAEWSQVRNQSAFRSPFIKSYQDYVAGMEYQNEMHRQCLYSRIGDRQCPLGGFAAVFNYIGLFVAAVGGALVIASRRPKPATQQSER